jgi:hypothetical protein
VPLGYYLGLFRARSVALVSKKPAARTGAAELHPNLAKLAISKLDQAILAGAGFETGATERALKWLLQVRFRRRTYRYAFWF